MRSTLFFSFAFILCLVVMSCQDPEPMEPDGTPSTEGLIINEFLAINDSCCADEQGDFDDWLELHNTSNSPIDIGGMYLTDKENDVKPYQMSSADPITTTIQPGGYLVIWWDDDQEQGILHISKKLSGDGESIILMEPDGKTVIDSHTFSAQTSDVSQGRDPNNTNQWISFSTPSPGSANIQ